MEILIKKEFEKMDFEEARRNKLNKKIPDVLEAPFIERKRNIEYSSARNDVNTSGDHYSTDISDRSSHHLKFKVCEFG